MPPAASHLMPPSDRNYLALAPKDITSRISYSKGSQASLSAQQPAPLGESLGCSNRHSFKTSKASSGHPRCSLNLVHLFYLSLLPVFRRIFLFLHPCGDKPATSSHTVLYQTPGSSAVILQSLVMPNTQRSSATWSVHSISFLCGRCCAVFSSFSVVTGLG